MKSFAAIFEADGRQVASYAIVADTPARALTLLEGMEWPREADRLRILDDQGIEQAGGLAPERTAGRPRRNRQMRE